jgi:hypothetical protein
MIRKVTMYAVAWIVVPVAFAVYISRAYSLSLDKGVLPFLGTHERRWWIGFVLALLIGAMCVTIAQSRRGIGRLLWPVMYIVAMAAVLLGTHLAVACGHGDCF